MGAQAGGTRPGQDKSGGNILTTFLGLLGPGLISGAADDDPTGIATYAQAGAQQRYSLLWTTLLTLPMMITVQYMAAKVAVVHRQGLTTTIRQHYPSPLAYAAVLGLLAANTINAGVDIGAIAAAIHLVLPLSTALLTIPIALFLLGFLVFGNYGLIQSTFKWLTLALLAYIVSSVLANPDWGAVLRGTLIPSFSLKTSFLSLFVAALGGNLSPYLFFWQSDLETSEDKSGSPSLPVRSRLRHVATDTDIGMVFSNLVIFFIEIASAATLYRAGKHHVGSAVQAAEALRPLLGSGATIMWAIGMVGSGLLAVPALTGSIADAVASLFGWERGLDQGWKRARRFYAVLGIAMLLGMSINFLGINPIQALILSAALNGFLTPPLLVLLLLIANRADVMGARVNGLGLNLLGWATVGIMSLAAIGLLITMV